MNLLILSYPLFGKTDEQHRIRNPAHVRESCAEVLPDQLAALEKLLACKPFLAGDRMTIADLVRSAYLDI